MARQVQFEGRTIEVPDDATDSEVAEILAASGSGPAAPPALTAPPDVFERPRRMPSASAATEPNPSTSFLSGLGEQLGITPEGLKDMIPGRRLYRGISEGDPREIVKGGMRLWFPPGADILELGEAAIRSPAEQGTRAGEEIAAHGVTPQAIGHSAAALVPVIGSQIGEIGELYGTDPWRAGGRTTGLIAPMLTGTLQGKKPTFAADKPMLTYSERTGKLSGMEQMVERSLIGSTAFREFRFKALDRTRAAADALASRISRFKPDPRSKLAPREQLGVEIDRNIAVSRAEATKAADKLMRDVDQIAVPRRQAMRIRDKEGNLLDPDPKHPPTAGREYVNVQRAGTKGSVAIPGSGAWVDISSWKAYGQRLKQIADDPYTTFPEPERGQIKRLAREIESAPRLLPWDSAQRTAEGIKRYLREDADISPSPGGATSSKLDRTLDKAMDDALEQAGGPELVEKYRAARQLRDENRAVYIDGILARLQKEKPEAIHRLISSDQLSFDDVRVMSQRLGRDQMRSLVAENLRESMENSVVRVREAGQVRDVIDAHKLSRELHKLTKDQKLDIALNDPKLANEIRSLMRDAEAMKQPPQIDVNVIDPGNRMLNLAQVARGDISPSIAGTGLAYVGAHKLLLSPQPWATLRNFIGYLGRGMTAQAISAGMAEDRHEQERKDRAAKRRIEGQQRVVSTSRSIQ